jgi:DNA-binding NtrC family response regulator
VSLCVFVRRFTINTAAIPKDLPGSGCLVMVRLRRTKPCDEAGFEQADGGTLFLKLETCHSICKPLLRVLSDRHFTGGRSFCGQDQCAGAATHQEFGAAGQKGGFQEICFTDSV